MNAVRAFEMGFYFTLINWCIFTLRTVIYFTPFLVQSLVFWHAARICWCERTYWTLVWLLSCVISHVYSQVVWPHHLLNKVKIHIISDIYNIMYMQSTKFSKRSFGLTKMVLLYTFTKKQFAFIQFYFSFLLTSYLGYFCQTRLLQHIFEPFNR